MNAVFEKIRTRVEYFRAGGGQKPAVKAQRAGLNVGKQKVSAPGSSLMFRSRSKSMAAPFIMPTVEYKRKALPRKLVPLLPLKLPPCKCHGMQPAKIPVGNFHKRPAALSSYGEAEHLADRNL